MECRIEGCERPTRGPASSGLCSAHLHRLKAGWSEEDMKKPFRKVRKYNDRMKCIEPGCQKRPVNNLRCASHYTNYFRAICRLERKKFNEGIVLKCRIEGCDREDIGGYGLCNAHYQRQKAGWSEEDMKKPIRKSAKYTDDSRCIEQGCDRRPVSRGRCKYHATVFYSKPRSKVDRSRRKHAQVLEVIQNLNAEALKHLAAAVAFKACMDIKSKKSAEEARDFMTSNNVFWWDILSIPVGVRRDMVRRVESGEARLDGYLIEFGRGYAKKRKRWGYGG